MQRGGLCVIGDPKAQQGPGGLLRASTAEHVRLPGRRLPSRRRCGEGPSVREGLLRVQFTTLEDGGRFDKL